MFRYVITSRALFPGSERERLYALIEQADRWIADDIDFLQIREKDLSAAALVELSRKILERIHLAGSFMRLLLNSRADIAIAAGAHGVHLTASAGELTASQIRTLYAEADRPAPKITLSCHTLDEISRARQTPVDAILFAPVFEKPLPGQQSLPGQGLERLRQACLIAAPIQVYALGGVTLENTDACLQTGAKGVAGIRLFLPPRGHHPENL